MLWEKGFALGPRKRLAEKLTLRWVDPMLVKTFFPRSMPTVAALASNSLLFFNSCPRAGEGIQSIKFPEWRGGSRPRIQAQELRVAAHPWTTVQRLVVQRSINTPILGSIHGSTLPPSPNGDAQTGLAAGQPSSRAQIKALTVGRV